jgi:predicted RNA binding protein YcfA (HicA-like mRNA interferase family)
MQAPVYTRSAPRDMYFIIGLLCPMMNDMRDAGAFASMAGAPFVSRAWRHAAFAVYLIVGHKSPMMNDMKPAELLRALTRLATRRDWPLTVQEGGSHTKVTLNGRRTVVPRHPGDLKAGTFRAIMKQLGLTPADLED